MSKFLQRCLINALYTAPEPLPKHPGQPRPFIYQDAERFIFAGNPVAVAYDSLTDQYSAIRNRNPDGHEQIQENPGPTSGGGSIPWTDDYIIAAARPDGFLSPVPTPDPAIKSASYRDANDRGRIQMGGLNPGMVMGDLLNPTTDNGALSVYAEGFLPGDDGQGGGGGDIGGGGDGGGIGGGGDIGGIGDDFDWGGGGGALCPDGSRPEDYGGGLGTCPNLGGGQT